MQCKGIGPQLSLDLFDHLLPQKLIFLYQSSSSHGYVNLGTGYPIMSGHYFPHQHPFVLCAVGAQR